jgi:hypothetical protein
MSRYISAGSDYPTRLEHSFACWKFVFDMILLIEFSVQGTPMICESHMCHLVYRIHFSNRLTVIFRRMHSMEYKLGWISNSFRRTVQDCTLKHICFYSLYSVEAILGRMSCIQLVNRLSSNSNFPTNSQAV